MNVFAFRDQLVHDYADYINSFILIKDQQIRETVRQELDGGALWPEPLIQLNPAFEPGAWIDDLVSQGILHDECRRIFRRDKDKPEHQGYGQPLRLHKHQHEAILTAQSGQNYVLTTGTGSGKSLAPSAEQRILNLKVCDVACGSGHILIAAAYRIARRLAIVRTGDAEPAPEVLRKALRDVIGHCIYGVDINPMAVELCKINLWLESLEPGKPLSFLDHHIQCGNSLIGATPALLHGGIPDEAFTPIEGDDKAYCSEFKKRNKKERSGQVSMFDANVRPWEHLGNLASSMMQLDDIADDSIAGVQRKQQQYEELVRSSDYENGRLLADAWCAAFVWVKRGQAERDQRSGIRGQGTENTSTPSLTPGPQPLTPSSGFAYPITDEVFRHIDENPHSIPIWMREEIQRLAAQYQFFHWHLAFPDVFRVPGADNTAENERAGWSDGFHCVLSNPPWERIKLQEKEWFASRRPDIANALNAATRKRLIDGLRQQDSNLYHAFLEYMRQAEGESHVIRSSGRYPLTAIGDVNTYTLFTELTLQLVTVRGCTGIVVPIGIVTDDTTKNIFNYLVDSQRLASVTGFINEQMLFPSVLHNFKFCLLVVGGEQRKTENADFAFHCESIDHVTQNKRHFQLSYSDFSLLNPNTRTCPTFGTKADAELTKQIYKRVPIFINEQTGENHWGSRIIQMFHMTNDSGLFRSTPDRETLPLYEGKMIYQYDHRFASYENLNKRMHMLPQVSQEQHNDPNYTVTPCYYVNREAVDKILSKHTQRRWLFGYRIQASRGLERTMVFSVLPYTAVGEKIPLIFTGPEINAAYVICLIANGNSLIFDYVSKQKVGGATVNHFIFKQFPVLPPSRYGPDAVAFIAMRVIELIYTAWDIQSFAQDILGEVGVETWNRWFPQNQVSGARGQEPGGSEPAQSLTPEPRSPAPDPFHWDPERRAHLRTELDAYYARLYGLTRDELRYILDPKDVYGPDFPSETFRVLKDREIREFGEYRTRRLVLEKWDQMFGV